MIEGKFIVLEGVDGAGTTTHTKLLADALRARGLPIYITREPSDGPIGMMLRQIITNRIVVPGLNGPRPPAWTTMALLFAADRMDHLESTIIPNLMDGVTVISDRYDYSSVAYQSLPSNGADDAVQWVRELNRHARRPDLTIVLDVPADVAAKRRHARLGHARDIFEHEEMQQKLGEFYRTIERYFPDDQVVHVNSARPAGDVAAEVMSHVRRIRGEA